MRVNIEVDDGLIEKAMKLSGAKNKREAIERGLQRLVEQETQARILKLKGKVEFWPGYNYKELRRGK